MRVVVYGCLCFALAGPGTVSAEMSVPAGERVEVSGGEVGFVAVAAVPGRLYAASQRAVHESVDGGKTWTERFRLPQQAELHALAVQGSEPATVLAATSRGLFGSFDSGATWSQVFGAVGEGSLDCTVVAFHPAYPHRAVLGTRRGLFVSADGGRGWQKSDVPLAARDIVHAAFHPHEPARLYLVTADGLWVGDLASGSWQQRRNVIRAEETAVEQPASVEPPGTGEEDGVLRRLSAVAIDPEQPATLHLATSRGVERSDDDGLTWRRLTRTGLASQEILDLALTHHSPVALYAATRRGLAWYQPDQDHWVTLSQGRSATRVNDLAVAPGALWAATDQGLFRFDVPPETLEAGQPPSPRELLANFSHEPTIAQVREAAIRYADVHPNKIRRWRREARWRALFPALSLSSGTNLTDFRHWDSGSSPDSLLRGERDIDWDASVSWELADLVWSTDQTSIDVRSKLMVELRDDIVDEATRTYFERRRIQVALLTDPPNNDRMLLEKELKIQELTALLDGLTGGYFSSQMRVDDTHKEEQ